MDLIHKCPICGKLYERNCTPEPDQPCNECELENITNPPIKYYIAGREFTCEEYIRFLNGEKL